MTTMTRRWLPRASFALMLAAVVLVLAVAGWHSLTPIAFAAIGVCAVLAGGYWYLANRGCCGGSRWPWWSPRRCSSWWYSHAPACCGSRRGGGTDDPRGRDRQGRAEYRRCGRGHAGRGGPPAAAVPDREPAVGRGKVTKFGLKDKAEALGAEVALLEGPGTVDAAALASQAVADGADLLGVAGGDGTQALVAGIAAEHGLPFLVISAGTRNHFALDLGLDREDPASCLDALTDGEELRVDLGIIGDRTFVNNASFGAYAEVVRSPAYRDDKRGTTLQVLPDLLNGHQGARLTAQAAGTTIEARRPC